MTTPETPNRPRPGRASEQYAIAERLGETTPSAIGLIGRVLYRLGTEQTAELLDQTLATEAAGGMLTEDGARRRTPGGVFFYLVKARLREAGDKAAVEELFPPRGKRPPPRRQEPERAPEPASDTPPSGPPIQGRLRPRMRGRSELPPAAPLSPSARPAAALPAGSGPVPTQAAVLAALDRHIGAAPDIYRRSYSPETGAMTLFANFPALAQERYGAGIARAAREAGVPIAISPRPSQSALSAAAHAALPEGFPIGRVVVHAGRDEVVVHAPEPLDGAALEQARERFLEETGWRLVVVEDEAPPPAAPAGQVLSSNGAIESARRILARERVAGSVGARADSHSLVLRLSFPDALRERAEPLLAEIRAATGWDVELSSSVRQDMLVAAAQASLPAGLDPQGHASIRAEARQVVVRCRGAADEAELELARQRFSQETGWELVIAEG